MDLVKGYSTSGGYSEGCRGKILLGKEMVKNIFFLAIIDCVGANSGQEEEEGVADIKGRLLKITLLG